MDRGGLRLGWAQDTDQGQCFGDAQQSQGCLLDVKKGEGMMGRGLFNGLTATGLVVFCLSPGYEGRRRVMLKKSSSHISGMV